MVALPRSRLARGRPRAARQLHIDGNRPGDARGCLGLADDLDLTDAQPTPVTGTPTAAQLAGAITNYYALVPDDTDGSWSLLTPSYQTSPSGGRKAYEKFWAAVDRVSVSGVTGKPPNKAEATVTYVYKDGRVVRERTAFGLVNDDGTLKINSSKVLSSSTE